MSVHIIETDSHVFEVVIPPGRGRRRASVQVLSGPALTDEQWGRVKEAVVREMIAMGLRVYGVSAVYDEPEDQDP